MKSTSSLHFYLGFSYFFVNFGSIKKGVFKLFILIWFHFYIYLILIKIIKFIKLSNLSFKNKNFNKHFKIHWKQYFVKNEYTRNLRLSCVYSKWLIALSRSVIGRCDPSLLQALLLLGVMQFTRLPYVSLTAKDASGEQRKSFLKYISWSSYTDFIRKCAKFLAFGLLWLFCIYIVVY